MDFSTPFELSAFSFELSLRWVSFSFELPRTHRDGHDFMRFPEPCIQRVCGLADHATNNGLETHKIMTVPICLSEGLD